VASLPRAAAPGPPLTLTEENVEARGEKKGCSGSPGKAFLRVKNRDATSKKNMVISLKNGTSKVRIGI